MRDGASLLIGKTIRGVEQLHDYVQLLFDEEARLTVFSEMKLLSTAKVTIESLVGMTISSLDETSTHLLFGFTCNQDLQLVVSRAPDSGPEVMTFFEGAAIVVWQSV